MKSEKAAKNLKAYQLFSKWLAAMASAANLSGNEMKWRK